MQVGRGGQVDLTIWPLVVPSAGDIVVGGERLRDVGRGQAVRGELVGIEPRAQREMAPPSSSAVCTPGSHPAWA